LNGECGAPDTPASQSGFAGNIFLGAIRGAHHLSRIRAARWLLRPAALDHAGAPTKSPARGRGFGDNGKAIRIANACPKKSSAISRAWF